METRHEAGIRVKPCQTVEKVIHILRHAQHERKNSNISKHSFVRLELVER